MDTAAAPPNWPRAPGCAGSGSAYRAAGTVQLSELIVQTGGSNDSRLQEPLSSHFGIELLHMARAGCIWPTWGGWLSLDGLELVELSWWRLGRLVGRAQRIRGDGGHRRALRVPIERICARSGVGFGCLEVRLSVVHGQ